MDSQKILEEIKKTKSYSDISIYTIQRLVNDGISKYKKEKDVVKYVKKELHITWGAFFKQDISFDKYLENPEELLDIHSSTRERKEFVSTFYNLIFQNIPISIHNIADYGCGLNPLNIPQMNLPNGCNYFAYDIYEAEIDFLNKYIQKHFKDINFNGEVRDIFQDDSREYDVTFLLKILPVLEEQKKNCSIEILKKINTKYFVVSFPLKSLSGKNVGMDNFYTKNFETLLSSIKYQYTKLLFENEAVYIVKKD